MSRIPVTILTGFLGAGKTTLLNALIQQGEGRKIAVIENEFGAINIDSDLVVNAESTIFELSDGCLCCTLNGELMDTLEELLESEYEFDHLIIETTGIAEPQAVAAPFLTEPYLEDAFRLDGTICVVDAKEVLSHRNIDEAGKQISYADVLVVNKSSEVSEEKRKEVAAFLKSVNPFARIEWVDYGKADAALLDLQAYEQKRLTISINAALIPSGLPSHLSGNSAFQSHSFTFDKPFDFLKFIHWMRVLLLVQGEPIYRIKGIFNFHLEDKRMIFQSVKENYSFVKGEPYAEGEERVSKVVFIGKQLNEKILRRRLESCLAGKMPFDD